ncbi:MAG: monovalent cation/H(+) antiporter subunit G [Chloroflexi bacterium]|nr:monovalent cation/H(+) antiporter subunit G [Chloroflexota bacterium]
MVILQILGLIALGVGSFFSIMGIVGIFRFPDVYTRLHATGKVSTLGLISLMIGSGLLEPSQGLKLMALTIFLLISAPVASHAISLAAYRQGVPLHNSVRDDLKDKPPVSS